MKTFDNAMKIAGYVLIGLGFTTLGYVSWLLFYTPKYFDSKQPYKVSKKEYRIGESVEYKADYCKYREYIPLDVSRNLVDGFVYPLPISADSLGSFPSGCREVTVSVPLILPDTTPTDKKYHIEIIVEYKINVLQTQTRKFITEEFTLIK